MATITDDTGQVIDVAALPDEPLVIDDIALDDVADDAPEAEAPAEPTGDVAFMFDGEEPGDVDLPENAPNWAKALRERQRDDARRARELERENRELKAKLPSPANEIGPKPTLESCGYDEDEKDRQLIEWHERKSKADRDAEAKAEAARKAQEAWADRVTTFESKGKEQVQGFADKVAAVADHFGGDEQGNIAKAILIYANDPRLVDALNASPATLAKLVALKNDPTALAIAVGELKGKIKAMPRASVPPPEKVSRGGAPNNNATDKELERLEREADRTGDRSAVIKYRRDQRNAA